MYKTLSKYPSIKRDITIETALDVPHFKIEKAVCLEIWNTKTRRLFKVKDIYQKEMKFSTFSLTVENIERQPEVNDIDFWIYMIDRYLKGLYINSEAFGNIQDYEPAYTHEGHFVC